MNISMAVCTYNRCAMLKDAVQSLLRQSIIKLGRCEWEIIIVDNNSTDGTAAYLGQLAEENPKIKIFTETKQGLGYARNMVLANAGYDIVAIIDDDEIADEYWAEELLRVFREQDNVGCVSGPYFLEHMDKIPKWFPAEMYGIIGDIRIVSDDYYETYARTAMGGGNMAISMAVIKEHSLAFPAMGRKGKLLLGGEEHALVNNIMDLGYRNFRAPRAKIYHKFIPERATVKYAVRFFKGYAYSRFETYKLPYYFLCFMLRGAIFPFKVFFNYKRRLYHFVRVFYEYYRIEASVKAMMFGKDW